MKIKKSQLNMLVFAAVAIVIGIVVLMALGSGGGSSATEPTGAAQTTIKMTASALSYRPAQFVVPAGKTVSWEITNDGASGCTQFLVARGLINGSVDLGKKGDTKVISFTAPKPGLYPFSCSMGMVSGQIKAV